MRLRFYKHDVDFVDLELSGDGDEKMLGTGWGWGLNSGDEIHYRVILYCLWTGDTAPFDT